VIIITSEFPKFSKWYIKIFLKNISEFLQQFNRHAGQLQLYAIVSTDRSDRDDDIEEPQRCVIAEYANSLGLSRDLKRLKCLMNLFLERFYSTRKQQCHKLVDLTLRITSRDRHWSYLVEFLNHNPWTCRSKYIILALSQHNSSR